MKTSLTFILFICKTFGAVLESAIKEEIIEKGKSEAYLSVYEEAKFPPFKLFNRKF